MDANLRLGAVSLAVVSLALAGCSSSGDGPAAGDDAGGGGGAADGGDAGQTGGGGGGGGSIVGPGADVVAAGVRWVGRVDLTDPAQPRFSWSGSGFVARFSGTSLAMRVEHGGGGPFIFKAVIDGAAGPPFTATAGQSTVDVATGLPAGVHTVEVYRQTEGAQGNTRLLALTVGGGGALMEPPAGPGRLIEIIGDSISAGYGTLGTLADTDCFATESHFHTYGAVTARALGADASTIAVSGRGVYRNYGGDMGDPMPVYYPRTLANPATPAWGFGPQPQAVVINLGTNDVSNGKGDPGIPFREAYRTLVQTVRARYPRAYIMCIIGPLLNAGEVALVRAHLSAVITALTTAGDANIELFDQLQPQTADKAGCSYHPNPAQNQLMADLITPRLRARLGW